MKKIFLILLSLTVVFMAACNKAESKTTDSSLESNEDPFKVVFMIFGGTLGDQGMNDASYSGIQKFAEENPSVEYTAFELAELQDFDSIASSYAESGYDLILCGSGPLSEFTPPLAEQYPDVKFAIIEGTAKGGNNLLNVRTEMEDGGFVSGAFAALMNEHLTGKGEVGFIGGVRNPETDRAQFGFAAGAKYVGGNSTPVFIGSFTDAAKSKEVSLQLLSGDVRIIQAWAGGANSGIFGAAEGEGYYAMGGATGQFHMSDSIIASQVKNTDNIAYLICTMAFNDNWQSGTMLVGLEEGAVGVKYPPDSRNEAIPQEIKDKVEELSKKVLSGEIVVPITEAEYVEFEKALK